MREKSRAKVLCVTFFVLSGILKCEVRAMTIGTNIKKLRTSQGLTQDQLAEKLYVTRQTVSNWERGGSLR